MTDLQSFVTGLVVGALSGLPDAGWIVEVQKTGQDYEPVVRVVNMRSGTGVYVRVDPLP